MSQVIAIALLSLVKLNSVVWFEWIDSESNPSDGLSRAGVNDPWTKSQDWSTEELLWSQHHEQRQQSLQEWRWKVSNI